MTRSIPILSCLVFVACKQTSPAASEPAPQVATAPLPTSTATASPSVSASAPAAAPATQNTWSFDGDAPGQPPAGFSFGRTGSGKEGRWIVQAAADAPSRPNVLAQVEADPSDYRFPVAVVAASAFKDVNLSVSCKPVSGSVDQACGLVWRFKDANNYYLTRANALEDNVRLYHVEEGNRIQFASYSGRVASGAWHRLRVEARGDRFVVYLDDKKVLDAKDGTFADAGKVGVWTKADSVTWFDDLAASAL